MRFLIPLVVVAGLISLFWVGLSLNPREVPSPFIDKAAPAFTLETLADAEQPITQLALRGQPQLLNVWATWCGGCRAEHDALLALAEAGVPIIGLNWKDERQAAQRWLTELGNPYTAVAYDPDNKVGLDYGVYGAPETFVIDAEGIIRHKHIGPLTEQSIRDTIIPLLLELKGS